MGVGTCVVSSGEGVTGEQLRFVGGEGAGGCAECGYKQFGKDGVQSFMGYVNSLLQVFFAGYAGFGGVEESEEGFLGTLPVAGEGYEDGNERKEFAVVAAVRVIGAESGGYDAGKHACGNVFEDVLVVGVATGPLFGVGKVRLVQVAQDGREGHRGALREIGAALFDPGVDGGFGGDADGFSKLDA